MASWCCGHKAHLLSWWFCVFCQLWLCADAKRTTQLIRFDRKYDVQRWRYFAKFGYDIGRGEFQVRAKLMKPKRLKKKASIEINVFLDEQWPKVETMDDMCTRSVHARNTQKLEIPPGGEWSTWRGAPLSQSIRPHIWYFALNDCNESLDLHIHAYTLSIEFHAWQANKSEFGTELRGMLQINIVYLVALNAYTFLMWRQTRKFSEPGSVHPVIWSQATVLIIQNIGQLLYTFHLWRYRFNGQGIKFFEVVAEILIMSGQIVQSSLLLLIGLGYTLLQSRLGQLDIAIPVCVTIGAVHILLVGIGKTRDDASYKYHENEGIVGWLLTIMRLLLYAWFVCAVRCTAAEGGRRIQSFCNQFLIAGTIYFLAFPTVFIITQQFAPYWQHCVMSVGMMVMQMSANFWLGNLFLRRSLYYNVSTLSDSFLPGGTKVGCVKGE